jgi:hypothetical protein
MLLLIVVASAIVVVTAGGNGGGGTGAAGGVITSKLSLGTRGFDGSRVKLRVVPLAGEVFWDWGCDWDAAVTRAFDLAVMGGNIPGPA